jgi:rhamnogalacturonan hydrolase
MKTDICLIVIIPSGNYALANWVTLDKGTGVGVQLDGIIYRTGTAGGTMVVIENSSDIEFFSSTGKGAIQGYGYQIHKSGSLSGARLVRLVKVTNFSMHDLALVDAPAFHLFLDGCSNGEVYNLAIRGGDHGGLDGVDVTGTNIHVHDVMVTNKDECVTVKSPSHNILIEQIYCNRSGGCAIGSLSTGTDISNVVYSKVYTISSNQMMMIKSNGGSGSVKNVQFNDFIGHSNAYSLNIDQNWSSQSKGSGNGVQLSNISFKDWKGTCANGVQRGPIQFKCASGAPCTGMSVSDFALGTDTGGKENLICQNAYGTGACLKNGSGGTYTTTVSISQPTGYSAPTLPDDVKSGFGFTDQIPIPSMPSSFYPGTSPLKPLAMKKRGFIA